jgi:membrane-associated HD superfamily phosphohydrolase
MHSNPYIRPLLVATLLVAILFNGRMALFVNIIVNMLILSARFYAATTTAAYSEELTLFLGGFMTGTMAVMFTNKLRRRVQYLWVALYLSLFQTGLSIVTAFLNRSSGTTVINWATIFDIVIYNMCSGFINIFLFFGLLPIFEVLFNIFTDFRLGELTSHNMPLLLIF